MNDDGFIMLSRRFFTHGLWEEERAYSRAEAWIDLIQSAAFRKTEKLISGALVSVPRGGIVASVRFLSDRWKWSNTKVCKYLDTLREAKMIETKNDGGITVISLCKYEQYNHQEKTRKRQKDDGEAAPGRQGDDEIEEGKQGEEGNTLSGVPLPPELASEVFKTKWLEYMYYRKKMKHGTLLPQSIQRQFARLAGFGSAIAITAIDETIGNAWQGLFPERITKRNGRTPPQEPAIQTVEFAPDPNAGKSLYEINKERLAREEAAEDAARG